MKSSSQKFDKVQPASIRALICSIGIISALVAPIVDAQQKPASIESSVGNFSIVEVSSVNNNSMANGNNTGPLSRPSDTSNPNGLQARAASNYLASRAATGLQLKQRTNQKPPATSLMGDPVRINSVLNAQWDLQAAAGEHKKYILVKKKPKHKKIKMEVYKPVMKYKKIKMKVPVKKMKKKKVKGYLIKKEKGHYH